MANKRPASPELEEFEQEHRQPSTASQQINMQSAPSEATAIQYSFHDPYGTLPLKSESRMDTPGLSSELHWMPVESSIVHCTGSVSETWMHHPASAPIPQPRIHSQHRTELAPCNERCATDSSRDETIFDDVLGLLNNSHQVELGHEDGYVPHEDDTLGSVETTDSPHAYGISSCDSRLISQSQPISKDTSIRGSSNTKNGIGNDKAWSTANQTNDPRGSHGSVSLRCVSAADSRVDVADLQERIGPIAVQYGSDQYGSDQYETDEQETNRPYFLQDILAETEWYVNYEGDGEASHELSKVLTSGCRRLETPATIKMSLLFALEISFSATFVDRPNVAPSLSTIFGFFFGAEYRWLAQQMVQQEQCSRSTVEELGNLNDFQANMMVDIISQYVRVPVRLVIIRPDTSSKSEGRSYTAYTMDALRAREAPISPGPRYVFLYNDQEAPKAAKDPVRNSHWFGVGYSSQEVARRNMSYVEYESELPRQDTPYRNIVPNAPTLDTALPFEFMPGITSEDLMIHFPNHVLYWPEVSIRVISDGYTWKNIADKITQYRPHMILKPNTVSYTMRPNCAEFFDDPEWSLEAYHNKAPEELPPSKLFGTKSWAQSTRYRPIALQPSWTLGRLARTSAIDNIVPGSGPFQKILQEALIYRPLADSFHNRGGNTCNPPLLPAHWEPSSRRRPKETKRKGDKTRAGWSSKHLTIPNSKAEKDQVLRETTDPLKIIENHTAKLYGELLLWMLSKNGGRKETGELTRLVRSVLRGRGATISQEDVEESIETSIFENGMKMPARSTFSKRKETALRNRAKASGTSHSQEFEEYEQEIWHGKEDATPHKQRTDKPPRRRTALPAETTSQAQRAAERVSKFLQGANEDGHGSLISSPDPETSSDDSISPEGSEEEDKGDDRRREEEEE